MVQLNGWKILPLWLFIRMVTSSGIVGWGEATSEGHAENVESSFENFREIYWLERIHH